MAFTWEQALGWNLDELWARARQVTTLVEVLDDIAGTLSGSVNPQLAAAWTGSAANAAEEAITHRRVALASMAGSLDRVAGALRVAHMQMRDGQAELTRVVAQVRATPWLSLHSGGVQVDEDATLPAPSGHDPAVPYLTQHGLEAADRLYSALAGGLARAMETLEQADRRCAQLLLAASDEARAFLRVHARGTLRQERYEDLGAVGFLLWLTTVPAPGTDPDEVADWWAAQDADAQLALLAAHPERLGSLGGLPPRVRDRANREVLARALASYHGQRAALDDLIYEAKLFGTGDDVAALMEQRKRLDKDYVVHLAVHEQLVKHEGKIDPATNRPLVVQLLTFEPGAFGGKGRAALAFGDVGTADDVAYVLPGLRQRVDQNFGSTVYNAFRLFNRSERLDGARSTATIAWLAYDTPDVINVASDNAAQNGADLLVEDLHGLRAARGSAQPHLTVVAHSYGSTTAGTAAAREDLGIDDLVLVGSPGANSDQASDLHVPPGHVWVGAASGDEVSWLQQFETDPATDDFGAVRFTAESPVTSRWNPFTEHSYYFDNQSESLDNIAKIVSNRHGEVVRADYRGDHHSATMTVIRGVAGVPERRIDPEAWREPAAQP